MEIAVYRLGNIQFPLLSHTTFQFIGGCKDNFR